ncbi:TonB-dependent siderophore receptor [Alkalilimnicola ehrlichii]|uniref:TonB-dependent receptor plug domain-containing protein n=1 Tax=Alkalilimnicola ehrlichii TaxID=351052 RepID=A0A3E0X389_9GAMM|nr:TonB-dependent receptor plug domain-containing protein [Alkalilimnicola ehrlichii]RFA38787.1 hypothetical protein CAL65_02420 [Alkalilimnicola ehrlichii]
MTKKKLAALAIALAAGVEGVQADTTALEPILVEAVEEQLSGELGRFGNRVEVIDREQIRRSGAVDAAQAIQMLVPGLYIAPKHGRFDYVQASLQGSRSTDVLWLVDGVRISNRLFGGTSPLDSIPAHMIERIEVLKGGQSLFYGTDALAGAVNIVTRSFARETDGELGFGFGTLGERQVSGLVREEIDGHRFVLFASHAEATGFTPYRDKHIEPSARAGGTRRGYDVTSMGGKYQRQFGRDARLNLSVIRNDAPSISPARPITSTPSTTAWSTSSRWGGISTSAIASPTSSRPITMTGTPSIRGCITPKSRMSWRCATIATPGATRTTD